MSAASAKGMIVVAIVMLAACEPPQPPRNFINTEQPPSAAPQSSPLVIPTNQTLTPLPLQLSVVPTPEPTMPASSQVESGLQPLIEIAITDLANRLSINRESIEVVSAQTVVWPDRSLGCPQPGMVYPQVLAEGYHIELSVKGEVYSYHGGEGRGPFLCESPAK
ncbi:MAG TPA: hypothetical protein VMP08_00355 [Anaerolineae bacterium]|nr:hypothetical protein [Anaerolineae bacterium]